MTVRSESISQSKLQDQVKEFLSQFKDKVGSYKYVEEIDQMMREVGGGERMRAGDGGLPEIDPLVGGGIVDGVVVCSGGGGGHPAAEVPELAVHGDGGGFPAVARVVRAERPRRRPGAGGGGDVVVGDGD